MTMQFKRILGIELTIFILIFVLINPLTSEVKGGEKISFSGVIESVSKDLKFIVVNEAKILISPGTQIIGKRGKIFKINNLRPKLYVAVEAVRKPNGIMAEKIVIKTSKR
jgi:hypothetical protein